MISDLHANHTALEAVLADIDRDGIEAIYCAGDLVGHGPHPNLVCEVMRARHIPTVSGNFDAAISEGRDDPGSAYATPAEQEAAHHSIRWTLGRLAPPAKTFLARLPFDLRFQIGESSVHLVHGSPRQNNEYLLHDRPASLFDEIAALEPDPVVVFGHTLRPWHEVRSGILWVNAGSVGRPPRHDPRAQYTVLTAAPNYVDVETRLVPYDIQSTIRDARHAGLTAFASTLEASAAKT